MCSRLCIGSLYVLTPMADSNESKSAASQVALRWLASLFAVPEERLTPDSEFGSDLTSSFQSDFSENELATVSEEVLYIHRCMGDDLAVAASVRTVRDFCSLVERYQTVSPTGCRRLLAR